MDEIMVHVEVEVNLTEDLEKIKTSVENIFGAVKFEVKSRKWGRLLIVETRGTESLTKLYNLLRREQIRDASRKVFFSGLADNSLTFYLNKQVAHAGHLSFSQQTSESPLGPIQVQIRCDNPRQLIEWLAPRTTKRKWHSQPK
jgi:predicted RNA binding protein with dsRBD fold (UPF0201 family)